MLSFAATFLFILTMIVFANLASSLLNIADSSSTSYFMFKICHNLCDLQFSNYFEYRHSKYNLRQHNFTVQTIHNAKKDWFRHFFNCIVSVWNGLSNDMVSASSLSLFKLRIHKFDLHSVASLVF